jgi:hypothetical protein
MFESGTYPSSASIGWTRWLDTCRQPIVLVFAASWDTADEATLDGIRGELRGLGAALVVATPTRSFCCFPDGAGEEPVPRELCTSRALASLYRRYGIRPLEVTKGVLVLTLLDEDGYVRIQSTRDAPAGFESAVLETLRWATTSAAFGTRVLYSRSEAVMLSLMGAVALPAAEACTPKSTPPPNVGPPQKSETDATTPWTDRSSAA